MLTLLSACSTFPHRKSTHSEQTEQESRLQEATKLLNELNNRLQTLETKLNSMNDKIDSTRFQLDQMKHSKLSQNVGVTPAPTENTEPPSNPTSGFVKDDTVLKLRQAMILFEGQKYPEAILAFSEVLEKSPDHPLAGSAQFYVAESYMMQKEYKLAIQEFQRMLNSYDRSPLIPDALREMVIAEENLKNTEDAAKHRQLLSSLFPQSSAALTGFPPSSTVPSPIPAHQPSPLPSAEPSHLDPPPSGPPTAPLTPEQFPETHS